jgi:hypothetical protein
MKPYLERALAAYSQGKDVRVEFTNKPALSIGETSTKISAVQLIGRWRRVDPERKSVTNITFNRDGTFFGNVEENSKMTWSFAGKWALTNRNLTYEYTASSGIQIPVGTKDQDKIIALTKDGYTLENALGLRETYVRIE